MPLSTEPAAAPGCPSSRRGFLRGLARLPLIGGGISLIGTPVAVAEPCTDALLTRYLAWLAREHHAASIEWVRRDAEVEMAAQLARGLPCRSGYVDCVVHHHARGGPRWWVPEDAAAEAVVSSGTAASRAALVLSAVGCDWREAGR